MKKAYAYIIAALAAFFLSTWIFNHVNPWLSFVVPALVILLIINKNSK